MMTTAFFIVTGRCAGKCPFCFYETGYLGRSPSEMGTEQLLLALDRLVLLGVRQLIITGGEPLMRPDLPELLRGAGRLGLDRLLLAGPRILDDGAARMLAREGIEAVSVSVHSVADGKAMDRALDMLGRSGRTRLTATVVFTRDNAGELPGLRAWAAERGLGMIIQPAFIPEGTGPREMLSPRRMSPAEWEPAAASLREWGRESGAMPYVGLVLGIYGRGAPTRPRACGMGSESLVVEPDGEVYPCFHRRDRGAGNLLHDAPGAVMERLRSAAIELRSAPCYGEHCVSLFSGCGSP